MKKFIAMTLLLAIVFCFTGCSSTTYEDTNGEDNYELETITEEQIINLSVGASGMSYKESSLADMLKSSEYYSKNFNGVEQLYLTNFLLPSDINIYIGHYMVSSGNFKLFVINNDEIIHVFDDDTFSETFRFEDLSGTFSIVAAGESANFTFYMDIY